MKTKLNLLLTMLFAVFCSSVADAQTLIYSNNFSLGGAVNIAGTAPTAAITTNGGSSTATWNDVLGSNDPGDLLANGNDNTGTDGDSWLLPFVPTNNLVYILTASITFSNYPGNWVGLGFARSNNVNVVVGDARLNDGGAAGGPDGFDWLILTENTGNVQYFAGPTTSSTIESANGQFTPSTGIETVQVQILLDTQTPTSLYQVAAFVNGIQMGSVFTYATNTITTLTNNIAGVGLTQQSPMPNPNNIQWNNFTLSSTYQPFVVTQPVVSQTNASGSAFTNKVTVMADANGGTLAYQWYANNSPLANGAGTGGAIISGANTNVLTIKSVNSAYEFTNYYVVVTNNYGSSTSQLGSLTVLTNPVVFLPSAPTNYVTLFAGSSIMGTNYVGASPSFMVTAIGAPTLTYEWLTNGVQVAWATNSRAVFTNLQAGSGPTNFVCIVSNSFGPVSNTWLATYAPTPLSPYPQSVLAATPVDFWRLNEPDNGTENNGVTCSDYGSGNNGIYTNTYLANTGYNLAESAETSARFGKFAQLYSYIGQIKNEDFAVANGANAEFTVEAWVNSSVPNGAQVVGQGVFGVNDVFELGEDTNSATGTWFVIRNTAGTLFKADSSLSIADGNWHHLVGVLDEASTNATLYIDGNVAATVTVTTASGLFENSLPIGIGSEDTSASGYDIEFEGFVDDVATYSHALSIGQVISQYASFGNTVAPSFVTAPPTNGAYLPNQAFTLPATVAGSGPLGYYWTNLTTASVIGSGQISTNGSMSAVLSVPSASPGLSGDQIELVVTNSVGSTNSLVITLFSVPVPVALDYSSPILYSNVFNGGNYSLAGTAPTAVNLLVGGTNTTWVDELGTNDLGIMTAAGIPTTVQADSWVLPFTPHAGYVYTFTTTLTFYGYPGNWTGPGFAEYVETNGLNGTNTPDGRYNSAAIGYDWMILTENSGNIQAFAGPSTGAGTTNHTPLFTVGVGTTTIQETLDTTGSKWKTYSYINGTTLAGSNTYSATPPIGAVGVTENNCASPNYIQWNSFVLTQTAPGGVPPYLLNPLPPSNVTLQATSPLIINATNFGSAPFGYYWSNTVTAGILGSGTSGTMTPLGANLSIGSVPSSWNGGALALVTTNAYGTNVTLVTLTVTNPVIIPTDSATITGLSIVGGTNAVITAANGDTGGTYYLRGSTNILTPLGQWLPVATNVITTNGSPVNGFTFIGTNVINAVNPQEFYILSNTN